MMRKMAMTRAVVGFVALAMVVGFVWVNWRRSDEGNKRVHTAPSTSGRRGDSIHGPEKGQPAGSSGSESPQSAASQPQPKRNHPLLKDSEELVLASGDTVRFTVGPELSDVVRSIVDSSHGDTELAPLTVDYPHTQSIFPPEMIAPTFLWHEPLEQVDTWLVDVAFADDSEHLLALVPGDPPPAGRIDPECIAPNNEVYEPTPYQASAKSWTPSAKVWAAIKQRSSGRAAVVTVLGFKSAGPWEPFSRGGITITTSLDPVGAPIFYRDVPLAPSMNEKGAIMPLGEAALTLINWRLRDISKPESRLMLSDMPTCANCHSFSADGKTIGMDVDGPQGDKGTYAITRVGKQTTIAEKDLITWNAFTDKPKDHKTIGFMSRISPNGRYAITTLNETLYVRNFLDYRFLQVFYPTRGILAYYCRGTGAMEALPGADDPDYVHCNPAWTPDGKSIVFARAEARDPYPEGAPLATHANDPAELQIQYDLYRIVFRDGKGGDPEPVAGASDNGMSNSFPKVSPDGKWIVFVKCRNGQLLRPDSKLWIVPSAGGQARLMRCNNQRMNSWHSFSPNSRWLVFSSKTNTPYTQMFLTHIDEDGNDSPSILIPNSTAANRAVNLPEFVNVAYEQFAIIDVPAVQYMKDNDRGIELAGKGRLDEALAAFDKALASRPDNWRAHVNAGVALLENGILDKARDRFNKALQIDPTLADAHGNLGVIALQEGKLDQAMNRFQQALKHDPDHFDSHANLAMAFWKKGMFEQATFHFREALRLNPKSARTWLELGSVLSERGMGDEAVKHFEKAVEMDPAFIDARLALANALATKGEFASAETQLRTAMKMAPDNLMAANELAWMLAVCPRADIRSGRQAVQLAHRLCTASRFGNPIFLSTLAAAYAEMGAYSEAVAIATKALQLVGPRHEFPAQRLRQQLEHYKVRKPYRWPSTSQVKS